MSDEVVPIDMSMQPVLVELSDSQDALGAVQGLIGPASDEVMVTVMSDISVFTTIVEDSVSVSIDVLVCKLSVIHAAWPAQSGRIG